MDCACQGCTERVVGCHGTCEKYAEYRQALSNRKKRIHKAKLKDLLIHDFQVRQQLALNARRRA